MSNSVSGNSNVSLPLSRAERLRQYRRRFPGPGRRLKVRLSDKRHDYIGVRQPLRCAGLATYGLHVHDEY
jgi:hypothetical protein